MNTKPHRFTRLAKGAAGALAGAIVLAGLIAGSPAHAATLDPGDEINGGDYTITVTPTERVGFDEDWGLSALNIGPTRITISTGCPEGYRVSSRTFVVTPDGVETGVSPRRANAGATDWGLQGRPITLAAPSVPSFENLTAAQLPTGINRLVVTCDSKEGTIGSGPIGDGVKYFVAYLEVDRAAESWKVVDRPAENPVEKTATTTALASTNVTATSATLTATVSPAEATGTVTFKNGAATVGTAELSGGSASVEVSGLTPNTAHAFTAEYAGDENHEASSGTVSLTTLPAEDSADPGVIVEVPPAESNDPTGLKLSTKPGNVTLSSNDPRLEGAPWTATGTLGNVVVNDDRRNASAQNWTLNGRATDFTGVGTIPASRLSWEGASGGTGFVAGSLDTSRVLSTGTASGEANVQTTITGTQLSLVVPADAPAGTYSSILTLTLI